MEELLRYGEKTYLLMKSSAGIAGTISGRVVNCDVVVDSSEGIKVPKRALAEWDSAGVTARIATVSYTHLDVYKRQPDGTGL